MLGLHLLILGTDQADTYQSNWILVVGNNLSTSGGWMIHVKRSLPPLRRWRPRALLWAGRSFPRRWLTTGMTVGWANLSLPTAVNIFTVFRGHQKMVLWERRFDVRLTMNGTGWVGPCLWGGFHPMFGTRRLCLHPLLVRRLMEVGVWVGRDFVVGGSLNWAFNLVQTLDAKGSGCLEKGRQELLSHVDFTCVGELQHGWGLIFARIFQDDNWMLAPSGLSM